MIRLSFFVVFCVCVNRGTYGRVGLGELMSLERNPAAVAAAAAAEGLLVILSFSAGGCNEYPRNVMPIESKKKLIKNYQ